MKAYVVEKERLENNLRMIKAQAGDTPIWAVVKGDGYGLGVVPLAKICRENGISRFAITEIWEGKALRDAGFIQEEILMLRATSEKEELEQMLDCNLIATVGSQADAVVLNGLAVERGTVAEAHLKIDTGMGRYGFLPTEMDKIISIYDYMEGIAVSGVYTHFHSAFCSEKKTWQQYEKFQEVLKQITQAGYETGMVHCANSSALFLYPQMRMGGVRVGSALLGRLSCKGNFGLKPVGHCQAQVEELRWIPKGHTCGYGAAWKAKHPTQIAIVDVGWYHGFGVEKGRDVFRIRDCIRGQLSLLKAAVLGRAFYAAIDGKNCRVLGHIGMLNIVLDVTDIECAVGDPVTLEINPLLVKGMPVEFR